MYVTKSLLLLVPIILTDIVVVLLYVEEIFIPSSGWGIWFLTALLMSLVCGGALINRVKYMVLIDILYMLVLAMFVLSMIVVIYFILLIKFSFNFYSFNLLTLLFCYALPTLTMESLKAKKELAVWYE